MKTKYKNNNPLVAPGTDITPHYHYTITVARTDHCFLEVQVWSTSLSEAEARAKKIAEAHPSAQWEVADSEFHTLKSELVKKGGRHD